MRERPQAPVLDARRVRRIREVLLDWYAEHGQPFPWRDGRNPYAALVAGVCSQQTQMSRVLPLWERWMQAFPTLEALARAETSAVLHAWERAGYPRRALALRDAARVCVDAYGGALPREPEALLALPGVGPFTAAIVRTFGFGEDVPAVDTNVVRVLGRLVHGDLQPARETPPAALAATAERLVPHGEGPRWNPALMDFGASVCTSRPRCDICVLRRLCRARPRFDAGERATPVRAQGAYDGSDRQWRGRLLGALREHDRAGRRSVPTRELLAPLASQGGDPARLRELLRDLVRDGLAWQRGSRCGLGDAPGRPTREAST